MQIIGSFQMVLKNKPCKRNNRQKFDNTENAAKQGNAEERPNAGCKIYGEEQRHCRCFSFHRYLPSG